MAMRYSSAPPTPAPASRCVRGSEATPDADVHFVLPRPRPRRLGFPGTAELRRRQIRSRGRGKETSTSIDPINSATSKAEKLRLSQASSLSRSRGTVEEEERVVHTQAGVRCVTVGCHRRESLYAKSQSALIRLSCMSRA
jgi:hypothetical protein